MELVGLSYSSWFVYRYLLFKARAPRKGPTANHAGGPVSASRARTAGSRRDARPAGLVATTHAVALPPPTARQRRWGQTTRAVRDLSFLAAP